MRPHLSLRYIISFLVLTLFLHELHEMAHMTTARLLCGCWGTRDFLYWKLCDGCGTGNNFMIITWGGPLLTYIIMWVGWWLLKKRSDISSQSWGMALIFASLPFARLFAAAFRGGDEIMAMRSLLEGSGATKGVAVVVGGLIVLVSTLPPLWLAYKRLESSNRLLVFITLLVIPYLFDKFVLEYGLNGIQTSGAFNHPVFWGASWLVVGYQVLLVILMLLSGRNISQTFVRQKT